MGLIGYNIGMGLMGLGLSCILLSMIHARRAKESLDKTKEKLDNKELPPGFVILYDDGEYVWMNKADGYMSCFFCKTRWEAINMAWNYYKIMLREDRPWRET